MNNKKPAKWLIWGAYSVAGAGFEPIDLQAVTASLKEPAFGITDQRLPSY